MYIYAFTYHTTKPFLKYNVLKQIIKLEKHFDKNINNYTKQYAKKETLYYTLYIHIIY